MNTFTNVSYFLLVAVVFLVTCPDKGKGYWTVDWAELDEKVLQSLIKRFDMWGPKFIGEKKTALENDEGRQTIESARYPGTYIDNTEERTPTVEDPNEPPTDDYNDDFKKIGTRDLESIPNSQSPGSNPNMKIRALKKQCYATIVLSAKNSLPENQQPGFNNIPSNTVPTTVRLNFPSRL